MKDATVPDVISPPKGISNLQNCMRRPVHTKKIQEMANIRQDFFRFEQQDPTATPQYLSPYKQSLYRELLSKKKVYRRGAVNSDAVDQAVDNIYRPGLDKKSVKDFKFSSIDTD